MNPSEIEQTEDTLHNAIEQLYRILKASRREGITDKDVYQNLAEILSAEHNVETSLEWVSGISYRGALSLRGAGWSRVQAFICVVNDPRTAELAVKARPKAAKRVRRATIDQVVWGK
tara:strand:- start:178 stop:528 length:351 start_codon:yes stop_codon:yes gene_type:complete